MEQKDNALYSEKIEKFLKKKSKEIKKLAESYPEEKSLFVTYEELENYSTEIADELIKNPDEVISLFEKIISEMEIKTMVENPRFHVRFTNLPKEKGYTIMVRDITSEYVNKLIAVEGVVNKSSDVLPKVYNAKFICNRCKQEHFEIQTTRFLSEPLQCTNCRKRDFRFAPDDSEWTDVQRLEVQEPLELLRGGEETRKVEIWLEDDLVDLVKPGDKVIITGMVRLRPPQKRGSVYQKFIEANWVEALEMEFEEIEISDEEVKEIKKLARDPKIHDKIIDSIAPSIYGYREIKEAIALQLFGGRPGKKLPDNTSVRPDIHVLLIGDPGVAKSRILQYVNQIAPKSIYVTGKGTTGAGLTATAEKDEFAEGAWTLKAGALVLASGGIAAIDEFDKMEKEDRSAMHEALEQQSYHPSTEIMLSSGETIKIGKLVDELIEKNKEKIIKGKDCELLPIDDIELLTTDFKKVFQIKADRISRHTAPKNFVKITYENGRYILVTPEHPVYVFKDKITTIRADKISEGDIAPAPRVYRTITKNSNLKIQELWHNNCKHISFPINLDEKFGRFLGYFVTEGHSYFNPKNRYAELGISNTDESIANEANSLFKDVFDTATNINVRNASSNEKATKDLITVRCSSQPLYKFFDLNLNECLRKASVKRIPNAVKTSPKNIQIEFLRTAFKGDGFIDSERFGFSTSSFELAKDYQDILLQQGIISYITKVKENKPHYKVVVSGSESMDKFLKNIVERNDNRLHKLYKLHDRSNKKLNYRDQIPAKLIKELDVLLREYKLNDGYFSMIIKNKQGSHRKVVEGYLNKISEKIDKAKIAISSGSPREIRKKLCIPINKVAESMMLSNSMITYLERNSSAKRFTELLHNVRKLGNDKLNKNTKQYNILKNVIDSDIRFIKVRKVELLSNDNVKWVYDVTVEPNHNFISEGLILHNTISIAKAGIVARFRANTSVLAASNPKFSRFDLYKPLHEQFDIPPTLVSRFDLIFPIKDILDKEVDRKIADHIIKMHKGKEDEMKEIQPVIEPDLFRKYIAYARKNIFPKLLDESAEKLGDYYVELRARSKETVSATPRQLEALIRLSESSAKIRLSDVVTISDADRAIKLTEFVLREVATDETGRIDIDRIAAEHPQTTRDKIKNLEEIIQTLINESEDNMASFEDIISEAVSKGIDKFNAERLLEELKRKGVVFEPKQGKFMFTEG